MKTYIYSIVDLYTRKGVDGLLRERFHRWLADGRFREEKEEALRRLWNRTEGAPAVDTQASLEALRRKRQAAGEQPRRPYRRRLFPGCTAFMHPVAFLRPAIRWTIINSNAVLTINLLFFL
jgi:ferric-dicitrate binding protein FerR (iron transport regulator)